MVALGDLLKELLSGRSATAEDLDIDLGRFETEDEANAARPAAVSREGIWRESSYDLQRGLEVSEEPLDSMPAELADAFLKR